MATAGDGASGNQADNPTPINETRVARFEETYAHQPGSEFVVFVPLLGVIE